MKKRISLILITVAALIALQGLAFASEPVDVIKANIKKSVGAVKASVPSITVQELKKAMDDQDVFFELVDVREPDEFAAGHLADALHIPRGKAEWITPAKIKDPNTKIYIYCKGGARGSLVTKMLLDAGYTDVTNVTGGFKAWAKAGYPFYNAHGQCVVTEGGFGRKPE